MSDKSNILASLMGSQRRSSAGQSSETDQSVSDVAKSGEQHVASNRPQSTCSNSSGQTVRQHKLKQRFTVIRKLGKGTYGKVQLAINKETGQEVAIKTIKKTKIENDQDLQRVRREIQIMSSIEHPHIIHIYEVFENKDKIVLVMQYAPGGELYEYVSDAKLLDDAEARRLFRQIATAIYYCHKNKICHRDLKLENILLDEKNNAKIADFGLSNVFDKRRQLKTFCGSPLYASPEIVQGSPYEGPEVDCWSLGVLLYTLVYGAMPFDGSNFKRLVKQISESNYYEPKEKSLASPLIRRLLCADPHKRANIVDVCSDAWVNGIATSTGDQSSSQPSHNSLLKVAQDMANLTPVRFDILLALAPSSPPVQVQAKDVACRPPLARLPLDQNVSTNRQTKTDDVLAPKSLESSIMEVDEPRVSSPVASYIVRDIEPKQQSNDRVNVSSSLSIMQQVDEAPTESTLVQPMDLSGVGIPPKAEVPSQAQPTTPMNDEAQIISQTKVDAEILPPVVELPTKQGDSFSHEQEVKMELVDNDLISNDTKLSKEKIPEEDHIAEQENVKNKQPMEKNDEVKANTNEPATESVDVELKDIKDTDEQQTASNEEKPKKMKKKIVVVKKKKRVTKKGDTKTSDDQVEDSSITPTEKEKIVKEEKSEDQTQKVVEQKPLESAAKASPGKVRIPETFTQPTRTETDYEAQAIPAGAERGRRPSALVVDVAQRLLQSANPATNNGAGGLASEDSISLAGVHVSDKKNEFERRASLITTLSTTPPTTKTIQLTNQAEDPELLRELLAAVQRGEIEIVEKTAPTRTNPLMRKLSEYQSTANAETVTQTKKQDLTVDAKPQPESQKTELVETQQVDDHQLPQPTPITRSYKKVTFTKDGACITETGKIFSHKASDGTLRRVERKSKVTHFPAAKGEGASDSVKQEEWTEETSSLDMENQAHPIRSNAWPDFDESSLSFTRTPFEKLITPLGNDEIPGAQFPRLSQADSCSSCSSGSTDIFDDIFDTWTGANGSLTRPLTRRLSSGLFGRRRGHHTNSTSGRHAHNRTSSSAAGSPRCTSAMGGVQWPGTRPQWSAHSSGYDSDAPTDQHHQSHSMRPASAMGGASRNGHRHSESSQQLSSGLGRSLLSDTFSTANRVFDDLLNDTEPLSSRLARGDDAFERSIAQQHAELHQRIAEQHKQLWKGSSPSLFAPRIDSRSQFTGAPIPASPFGRPPLPRSDSSSSGAAKQSNSSHYGKSQNDSIEQSRSSSSSFLLKQSIALDAKPRRIPTAHPQLPPVQPVVRRSVSRSSNLSTQLAGLQLEGKQQQQHTSSCFVELKRADSKEIKQEQQQVLVREQSVKTVHSTKLASTSSQVTVHDADTRVQDWLADSPTVTSEQPLNLSFSSLRELKPNSSLSSELQNGETSKKSFVSALRSAGITSPHSRSPEFSNSARVSPLEWIQTASSGPLDSTRDEFQQQIVEDDTSFSLLDQLRFRGYRSMINQRMTSGQFEQQQASSSIVNENSTRLVQTTTSMSSSSSLNSRNIVHHFSTTSQTSKSPTRTLQTAPTLATTTTTTTTSTSSSSSLRDQAQRSNNETSQEQDSTFNNLGLAHPTSPTDPLEPLSFTTTYGINDCSKKKQDPPGLSVFMKDSQEPTKGEAKPLELENQTSENVVNVVDDDNDDDDDDDDDESLKATRANVKANLERMRETAQFLKSLQQVDELAEEKRKQSLLLDNLLLSARLNASGLISTPPMTGYETNLEGASMFTGKSFGSGALSAPVRATLSSYGSPSILSSPPVDSSSLNGFKFANHWNDENPFQSSINTHHMRDPLEPVTPIQVNHKSSRFMGCDEETTSYTSNERFFRRSKSQLSDQFGGCATRRRPMSMNFNATESLNRATFFEPRIPASSRRSLSQLREPVTASNFGSIKGAALRGSSSRWSSKEHATGQQYLANRIEREASHWRGTSDEVIGVKAAGDEIEDDMSEYRAAHYVPKVVPQGSHNSSRKETSTTRGRSFSRRSSSEAIDSNYRLYAGRRNSAQLSGNIRASEQVDSRASSIRFEAPKEDEDRKRRRKSLSGSYAALQATSTGLDPDNEETNENVNSSPSASSRLLELEQRIRENRRRREELLAGYPAPLTVPGPKGPERGSCELPRSSPPRGASPARSKGAQQQQSMVTRVSSRPSRLESMEARIKRRSYCIRSQAEDLPHRVDRSNLERWSRARTEGLSEESPIQANGTRRNSGGLLSAGMFEKLSCQMSDDNNERQQNGA